jgi:hypothetical protein
MSVLGRRGGACLRLTVIATAAAAAAQQEQQRQPHPQHADAPPPPPNILALLERDVQGKVSPFLAGRRGSFYLGGQSLAANNPLTTLWNVRENETLGFMHPYFRDGRARGIAITCDELTGCGALLNRAG